MNNFWALLGGSVALFWCGFIIAVGVHAGRLYAAKWFGPTTVNLSSSPNMEQKHD